MVKTWHTIVSFNRLIRLPNLLIIVLTQSLIRWSLIGPLLKAHDLSLQMSNLLFFLLVLSTVLITAGGYVINDYFDRKIDTINNPEDVVVGRTISLRHTMTIHMILTILGVLLGLYVAWAVDFVYLGVLFLLGSGILWFYSITYKRQMLIGNLIVALMTAMIPMLVLLFELPLQYRYNAGLLTDDMHSLTYIVMWVVCFSGFAFILTLAREIIKDAEDIKGDTSYGRLTLPAVAGMGFSKFIVIVLFSITALALILIYFLYLPDRLTLFYILLLLIIPLLTASFLVYRANDAKAFHTVSILTKCIMIAGLLYVLVANYIIHHYS
ncbi:MAG: geranylgeranylglycerol-phosphate geranylgeranyltransferase [Bacteroidales bacterium]|nr:geranylgeranylglycerol-phosphate geranylgeranyltransferase [Bacteroidales bacterium]MBN2763360.1 geranylgeranylglycerol-phosphate geranylgeranyltransferase [Bacteroidales bacterium]